MITVAGFEIDYNQLYSPQVDMTTPADVVVWGSTPLAVISQPYDTWSCWETLVYVPLERPHPHETGTLAQSFHKHTETVLLDI